MLDALAVDPAATTSWDDPYDEEELEAQWWTEAVESIFGAYVGLMLPTSEPRVQEVMRAQLSRQYNEWARLGFPDAPEWAWMKRLYDAAEDLLSRSSATWESVDEIEIDWHADPHVIVEQQFVRHGHELLAVEATNVSRSSDMAVAIRCRSSASSRRTPRRIQVRRRRPSNKSPGDDDPEPARGRRWYDLALAGVA